MDKRKSQEIGWDRAWQLFMETTFVVHLFVFLGVTLLLAQDILKMPVEDISQSIMGGIIFLTCWGIGLFVHGISASSLILRLLRWQTFRYSDHERLNLSENPKPRRIELGNDGELIEYFEDETQPGEKTSMDKNQ